jgi:hypothetical protein
MKEQKKLQRVNSRLGYTQNKWLDEESARTGISKSSLIQMAVEQYIAQKQALNAMYDMESIIDKLEGVETLLKNQSKEC